MSTDRTNIDGVPRPDGGQDPNDHGFSRRNLLLGGTTLAAASALGSPAQSKPHKRSSSNRRHRSRQPSRTSSSSWATTSAGSTPSIYHRGIMGYRTPNIDRIGKEGAMFTDWYGQQSCTAGRAAFITGQSPHPHRPDEGRPARAPTSACSAEDPTIAEILKPLGYATGQFGKNHLGDKDEFLPTNHGFDEFFGNLYHLNAEEEPENPEYPKNPEFRKRFGPRGVLKSTADGKIEDTGPLTKKRMETVDEEFLAAALDFIDRQHKAGKPFFCWFNSTRMHVCTHLKKESEGKTGLGIYPGRHGGARRACRAAAQEARRPRHRRQHHRRLHHRQRRRSVVLARRRQHAVPRREGHQLGGRLPCADADPLAGVIKPGTIINDMCAHEDLLPTFAAAAGEPDVVAKCLEGLRGRGGKTFKVHLDGYNLMPVPQGRGEGIPAQASFLYWNDDGQLCRRPCRALQGRFSRATVHGPQRLARGIHSAPHPEGLQPAFGSRSSAGMKAQCP